MRRLYNVSGSFGVGRAGSCAGRPADWAEQLAALTLEQGMATYILATDDVDDVRRFGEEVAPLVRDLVATERERRREPDPRRMPSPSPPVPSPPRARGA